MVLDGRYDLLRLLKSSQGVETYLAADLAGAGAEVVVKLLRNGVASPALAMRLRHEASVLARLNEPAVGLLRFGTADGSLYLVQPYLSGETLAERLSSGPLPVPGCLAVAADLLTALQHAHDLGILHRDVKPANVVVQGEPPNKAALIDFGLSFSASLDPSLRDEAVGTARYLAPEQAGLVDSKVDERSDLYSLGVVLYECLAGRPPFDGTTMGEVLRQHLNLAVPGLRASRVDVPRALEEVVLRLLAKEPGKRYQTAAGALADVHEISRSLEQGAGDPSIVIGLRDTRSVLAEPAFVGRAEELESLSHHLELAARGLGGLVFLAAESGGGKSRLLQEFAGEAASKGAWILQGQGVAQAAQRPYQVLEGVARGIDAETRHNAGVRDHIRAVLGDRAEAAAIALPDLAGVLGRESPGQLPEAYGEVRTLSALSALLGAAGTAQRPAVVLLDDCQWADGFTAKLLARWQSRSRQRQSYVLVVAAFRTEEVGDAHPLRQAKPQAEISLCPLTPAEIRNMAQSMAGALPEEAIETVAQLAEGSPFMAAAVLMGLVECGAVVESPFGWTINPQALADAQTSRRAAIFLVRRLELLSGRTLRLLSIGAVLGKDFDLAPAASLTGHSADQTLAALAEARRRRIVWVDEAQGRCHFVHDKIREALLGTMSEGERTCLHLQAAESIEALDPSRIFELAYHFDAAGAAERALPYAVVAAEHARRQHTLEISEAHYRMAARSCGDADRQTRLKVATGLGEVLTLGGAYDEAVAQFRLALELAPDRVEKARLKGKLGDVAFRCGDMVGARDHLEGALRQLKARMPRTTAGLVLALVWEILVQMLHSLAPRWFLARRPISEASEQLHAIRIYSRLAYVYWFHSGKIRCGWAHLREMNLAERYPPTLELAQAYSEHAPVMTMIPWFSRGLRYVERSLEIRTALGDVWGQGQSLSFAGVGLYAASRYREAIDRCLEAKRLMERTGDRWEVNTAGWNIAFAQYRLGELRNAVATAKQVYASAVEIGDQAAAGISLSGWSRASGGQVPAELISAQFTRAELEDASTNVEVHLAEAVRLLGAGQIERAIEVLQTARDMVRRAGLRQEYVAPILPWLATALRIQAEQLSAHSAVPRRQMFTALNVARRAVRLSRSYRNNRPHALREQGLLAALDGRPRSARRRLMASLEVARFQGARHEEAETLRALGRVGAPLGWPEAAESRRAGDSLLAELRGEPAQSSNPDTLSLADRFATVLEMGRTIASASEPEGVYDAVRQAAIALLRGDQCMVVDMHGRASGSLVALQDNEALSRTMVEQAIEEGGPVVRSLGDDMDVTESLVLSGVRSVLCAPIASKDGATKACFYVTSATVGGLFGPEEVQLASFIATLAGAALDQVAGSEARFTSLAQNSSDVITIIGRQGLIDYQSSSVQRIFGFQPLEMTGSRLAAWIHPDDAPEVLEEIGRTLKEGRSHARIECRLRAADGTWRETETTLTNLVDDPSVHGVVLNTRDVSERKAMEAERRRDTEALRLSQAQLAAAQRIGHFGSFQWDVQSDRLTWSDELHNIFGVPPEAFAGTVEAYFDRLHPDDAERVQGVLQTALNDGGDFEMEHRILRPDGAVAVLHCRGEVILGAGGRPERLLGVAQDVTEQKRVEDALRVSEDRARAAMDQALEASRLKSQFLATMSHEIRTPMNGILGMAHLLLDTNLTAGQRRYVMALQDSGISLLQIINDILDFSKVEAGKVELERIDFDLRRVVDGSAELFVTAARSKGLSLSVDIDPDVNRWVAGDPVRLRQILTNLTGNAIKFTDSGRVDITVSPAAGGRTRFQVIDTGIGIPPEARSHLLDPFVQADASTTRRFGGTGLGLAISHQLVKLMGGVFDFDSRPAHGSTFWFEIPLPPAAGRPADLSGEPEGAGEVISGPSKAGRALLVEDSYVNQLVAAGMLEKLGYQVSISANGEEAVKRAAAEPYHVILMDCLMPVMDGYEATRRIRHSDGPNRRTPIVALTASAMAGDRERCLVAGMDDYLSKPLDPGELAATVSRLQEDAARLSGASDGGPADAPSVPHPLDEAVLNGLRTLGAGGDGSFLRRVVEAYLEDTPSRLAELRSAIDHTDADATLRAAHTLKGSCRNIGARRMAELCETLERMAGNGDLSAASETFALAREEFAQVRAALAEELHLAT
jgi:PAS domain S-box-containing protein